MTGVSEKGIGHVLRRMNIKRQDIQNAITQAGHVLEYLSAYLPDFNPIEHKWAQAKAIRKQQNKTAGQLFKIESLYVA